MFILRPPLRGPTIATKLSLASLAAGQFPMIQSVVEARDKVSHRGSYSLQCMVQAWLSAYHPFETDSVQTTEQGGRRLMPLMQIVIVLIVVGILLWLVNRYIPMRGTIKSILNAVVVIAVMLWLLNVFGLFNSIAHIRVGGS
jgi:hypothetical protein